MGAEAEASLPEQRVAGPDRIAELEAELAQLNATYRRLAADFENYKRRKGQEGEELARYGAAALLQALLPALDNLERATSHLPDDAADGLAEGLRLTGEAARAGTCVSGDPADRLRGRAFRSSASQRSPDRARRRGSAGNRGGRPGAWLHDPRPGGEAGPGKRRRERPGSPSPQEPGTPVEPKAGPRTHPVRGTSQLAHATNQTRLLRSPRR